MLLDQNTWGQSLTWKLCPNFKQIPQLLFKKNDADHTKSNAQIFNITRNLETITNAMLPNQITYQFFVGIRELITFF